MVAYMWANSRFCVIINKRDECASHLLCVAVKAGGNFHVSSFCLISDVFIIGALLLLREGLLVRLH